jgi:RNA polymerase sigma-70 factor (ECF subfamily)
MSPEVLGGLIDAHAAALALYAAQWTDSAADVVQEAFVQLLRRGELPEPITPWLYRVVRNGAINAARAASRRRRHETAAAAVTQAWFESSPATGIEAEEATRALEHLPAEQREVIVARLWGDLSFQEIADITGTAASTVCRRYHLGIETLRKRLTGQWLSNRTIDS